MQKKNILTDEELQNISGGSQQIYFVNPETGKVMEPVSTEPNDRLKDLYSGTSKKGKFKCPRCGKTEMTVKFKKFQCQACGFERKMG